MTVTYIGNYTPFPKDGEEGGASGYVDSFILDDDNEPFCSNLDESAEIDDENDSPILASANDPILDDNNEFIQDSNREYILDTGFSTQTIFSTDNRISDGEA